MNVRKCRVKCKNGHQFSAGTTMVGKIAYFAIQVPGKKQLLYRTCPRCNQEITEEVPNDAKETIRT